MSVAITNIISVLLYSLHIICTRVHHILYKLGCIHIKQTISDTCIDYVYYGYISATHISAISHICC